MKTGCHIDRRRGLALVVLSLSTVCGRIPPASAGTRCDLIKIRTAAILAKCQLRELAKAEIPGGVPDYGRCAAAVEAAFARAEERTGGTCPRARDSAHVFAEVGAMTSDLAERLLDRGVCTEGEHEVCDSYHCVPIDACASVKCQPYQTCQIYERTGETYCSDTCDSFACDPGYHCELVDVTCVRAPCPPIANCIPDSTSICELPYDIGPCDAALPRWYYDTDTGKCMEFVYGGCGGNGNNFLTEEDCHEACGAR